MTAANAKYYHADHQGSIIALSEANGDIVETTSYSPFGVPSTLMPGHFAYTGQALLPSLDLYHYKARVYHPALGRFLQTDPIGYKDQQNWYAYGPNDPMSGADPSGMFWGKVVRFGGKVIKHRGNVFKAGRETYIETAIHCSAMGRVHGGQSPICTAPTAALGHNGSDNSPAVATIIMDFNKFHRPADYEDFVDRTERNAQENANEYDAPVYIWYRNVDGRKGDSAYAIFTPD